MTKKAFVAMTGEHPEDVLGPDWQNILAGYEEMYKKALPRNKVVAKTAA